MFVKLNLDFLLVLVALGTVGWVLVSLCELEELEGLGLELWVSRLISWMCLVLFLLFS